MSFCFPCLPWTCHEASDTGKDFLINIIAGVVTVALVLLVLVVLITHVATKRFTKKKLLKPPSKPPDDSPDSCEVHMILLSLVTFPYWR